MVSKRKGPLLIAELTNNLEEALELNQDEWFAQAQKIVVKLYEMHMKSPLEALTFLQEGWIRTSKIKSKLIVG